MDLGSLGALSAAPEHLRTFRRHCLEAWNLAEEMPKPVICAIQGACIGGALELALACDFRVLAADAIVGMPETRIGLIPDVGGSSRLPQVVGLGRAKELVMTGKLIGAEEAERIGLATRVAPAEELDAAVTQLVDELLACAPLAVALAKRVMDASARPALATTLELEVAGPGALRRVGRLRRGRPRVRREARAGVQRLLARPVDGPAVRTWEPSGRPSTSCAARAASSSRARSTPVSAPISCSIETTSSVATLPVAPSGTGQPPSSPKLDSNERIPASYAA